MDKIKNLGGDRTMNAIEQLMFAKIDELVDAVNELQKSAKPKEPEMKLYWIDCSCAHPTLTVAESAEKALAQCGGDYDGLVVDIDSIEVLDGYRIKLEKIED